MIMKKTLCILGSIVLNHVFTFACQCWIGDGAMGVGNTNQPSNGSVYLTGIWEDDGATCNIVNRCGDIYVVLNQEWGASHPTALHDINGSPNYVEGTGTGYAFYDVEILLAEIPPGEYDIVMDGNGNGVYDPSSGDDFVLGDGAAAGLVIYWGGAVPSWMQERTDELKAQAARDTAAMHPCEKTILFLNLHTYVSSGISLAINLASANFVGIAMDAAALAGYSTDYDASVITIGKEYLQNVANTHKQIAKGIVADPPDSTGYMILACPAPSSPKPLLLDNEHNIAMNRAINRTHVLNQFRQALLTTLERYQGARDMGSIRHARFQAKMLVEYSRLSKQMIDSVHAAYENLGATWDMLGLAPATASDSANLRTVQERLANSGYTAGELNTFYKLGLSDSTLDSIKNEIIAIDTRMFSGKTGSELWNKAGDTLLSLKPALDTVVAFGTQMVNEFTGGSEYGLPEDEPAPQIDGPYVTTPGVDVSFSATGTTDPNGYAMTYKWDLDGDSLFDDDTGEDVTFSYAEPGVYIVGLEVENEIEKKAYRFSWVEVNVGNFAPEITSRTPDTAFVFKNVSELPVGFSVTCNDPESDPVTVEWLVDDSTVHTGGTYNYDNADTGIHIISCKVSDTTTGNLDNKEVWKLHLTNATTGNNIPRSIYDGAGIIAVSPNPFERKTRIDYSIPHSSKVTVRIINQQGEVVETLVSQYIKSGTHSAVWDAGGLPPGIYMVEMFYRGQVFPERIILQK